MSGQYPHCLTKQFFQHINMGSVHVCEPHAHVIRGPISR